MNFKKKCDSESIYSRIIQEQVSGATVFLFSELVGVIFITNNFVENISMLKGSIFFCPKINSGWNIFSVRTLNTHLTFLLELNVSAGHKA